MMRACLHLVENLDRGSVESWLLRMLRHARRRGVQVDWTFYCALDRPGTRDAEAMELGARVVHSPVLLGRKAAFLGALRRELRRGGYGVMHAHHDLVSAVYLAAAAGLPLRRIVHVHNADEHVPTPSAFKQRLLREPMRWVCLRFADRIVANSDHSLDTFLGGRLRRPQRDVVLQYGIDPAPFTEARRDREAVRHELGLPADARLVLFAGRMVPEKNPLFAVDVLAEMHANDPRVAGLFVGEGSLSGAARERADLRGLNGSARFLGWRTDVSRIMQAADWFILPHPEERIEGFGMAVVEAQLAGLPLLLSRGVPDDPLLPTACYRRLPLAAGPGAWAAAAADLARMPAPDPSTTLRHFAESPMAMDRALDALLGLHA